MAEGEELGLLKRIVTIPAGTEPYDLGRQIVAVKGKPAGAPGRPMDATLTTVDGQSLTLASLRGKQVVIVFWASWSEPSRKALAGLKAVRDEFAPGGRVEFIAASVDDEADSLREAVASVPAGFTPVRLAMGERVAVIEAFEVGTLPAVLVLGPDGRVVARNLEAGRLRDLLRQELAGH
jgi:thiol-disulfide isomerase/thioredoxin